MTGLLAEGWPERRVAVHTAAEESFPGIETVGRDAQASAGDRPHQHEQRRQRGVAEVDVRVSVAVPQQVEERHRKEDRQTGLAAKFEVSS